EKQAEPEEVPAKDVDEPWKKHQEKFASQPQSEACQSEDAAPCDYYNREVVGSTVVDQTPTAIVQPPPPYPRIPIRRNLEGTVELEVLVCSNGKPINVRVKRSSGYRFFDQSA
ncbi:TonB family protein, partial [Arthrospira platensis SPKY1]|nr:TonB family protein [Arthrospira platensis SPKY1]